MNFDLTDSPEGAAPPGVYGLFVPDPGDAHGVANHVYATIGEQQFDFHVAEGTPKPPPPRGEMGPCEKTRPYGSNRKNNSYNHLCPC